MSNSINATDLNLVTTFVPAHFDALHDDTVTKMSQVADSYRKEWFTIDRLYGEWVDYTHLNLDGVDVNVGSGVNFSTLRFGDVGHVTDWSFYTTTSAWSAEGLTSFAYAPRYDVVYNDGHLGLYGQRAVYDGWYVDGNVTMIGIGHTVDVEYVGGYLEMFGDGHSFSGYVLEGEVDVVGTNHSVELSGYTDYEVNAGYTGNPDGSGGVSITTDFGDDEIETGQGADYISSGDGRDDIFAGDGNDIIDAGDGDDYVDAGYGNDTVRGSDGDDYLRGGEGDDVLGDGAGQDYLDGGRGSDLLVFTADGEMDTGNLGYDRDADLVLIQDLVEVGDTHLTNVDLLMDEIVGYTDQGTEINLTAALWVNGGSLDFGPTTISADFMPVDVVGVRNPEYVVYDDFGGKG